MERHRDLRLVAAADGEGRRGGSVAGVRLRARVPATCSGTLPRHEPRTWPRDLRRACCSPGARLSTAERTKPRGLGDVRTRSQSLRCVGPGPGSSPRRPGSARWEDVPLPQAGAPRGEAGAQRLARGPPTPRSWHRRGRDGTRGPRGPRCRGPAPGHSCRGAEGARGRRTSSSRGHRGRQGTVGLGRGCPSFLGPGRERRRPCTKSRRRDGRGHCQFSRLAGSRPRLSSHRVGPQ